jgi:hypothetical protein
MSLLASFVILTVTVGFNQSYHRHVNESLESIIDNHNRRIKGLDGDDDGAREDLKSIILDIDGTKNIDKNKMQKYWIWNKIILQNA